MLFFMKQKHFSVSIFCNPHLLVTFTTVHTFLSLALYSLECHFKSTNDNGCGHNVLRKHILSQKRNTVLVDQQEVLNCDISSFQEPNTLQMPKNINLISEKTSLVDLFHIQKKSKVNVKSTSELSSFDRRIRKKMLNRSMSLSGQDKYSAFKLRPKKTYT